MIKKTITYTDFNDETHTEDFYFNLNKAELTELYLINNVEGSFEDKLQALLKAKDARSILGTFKEIIDISFGVKSFDGKRFVKSPEILEEFKSSNAYSELIMDLFTEQSNLTSFIQGLLPSNLKDEAVKDAADIRARSEASMQGHQQKKQDSSVQTVPELPTESPVLEPSPVPAVPELTQEQRDEIIRQHVQGGARPSYQQH